MLKEPKSNGQEKNYFKDSKLLNDGTFCKLTSKLESRYKESKLLYEVELGGYWSDYIRLLSKVGPIVIVFKTESNDIFGIHSPLHLVDTYDLQHDTTKSAFIFSQAQDKIIGLCPYNTQFQFNTSIGLQILTGTYLELRLDQYFTTCQCKDLFGKKTEYLQNAEIYKML